MANIKSAQKRILVNEKKKAQNNSVKSRMKTDIKKVRKSATEGNNKEVQTAMPQAFSSIDKAAKKGVISKNSASRKKASLAKNTAPVK